MSPPMTSKTRSDFANVFQGVAIEVDELLCAEVESRPAASGAQRPARDLGLLYRYGLFVD